MVGLVSPVALAFNRSQLLYLVPARGRGTSYPMRGVFGIDKPVQIHTIGPGHSLDEARVLDLVWANHQGQTNVAVFWVASPLAKSKTWTPVRTDRNRVISTTMRLQPFFLRTANAS